MSWIAQYEQESRLKRKRLTKLSVIHSSSSRRQIDQFKNILKQWLPPSRKRLRTDQPSLDLVTSPNGKHPSTDENLKNTINDVHDSETPNKTKDPNESIRMEQNKIESSYDQVIVDVETAKAIELEILAILPTSLYRMATYLAESEPVLFLHSQSARFRKYREKSIYFSVDSVYRTSSKTQHANSYRGSRKLKQKYKKPSIGLLSQVYFNSGILREEDVDDHDEEFSPESELKRSFLKLSKHVGSLDNTILNWNDAKKYLDLVLIFEKKKVIKGTKMNHTKEVASIHKSNRGFMQYLSSITARVQKIGFLKPGEKWQQIKYMDTKVPPLTDEFAKVQLNIDEAKSKRKEDFISHEVQKKIDDMEEAAKKEKESALQNMLRPLTSWERLAAEKCIYEAGPGHEIIASSDTDSVQRDSIRKLQPRTWLNDEVIHYYLLMLSKRDEEICKAKDGKKRSHFFKSFFITKLLDENGYTYKNVKRWSKKVPGKDIFNLDKIIIPVNISGMHWSLLTVFVQKKKIQFFDSMGGDGTRYLEGLMNYMKDEHMDKKKNPLENVDDWKLVGYERGIPQQENGYDCGVFACMYADFISQDLPLKFSQDQITECRERIALSIINGKAMD